MARRKNWQLESGGSKPLANGTAWKNYQFLNPNDEKMMNN
jgi:hypothetical protein